MYDILNTLPIRDNGGRRSEKDRREFSYSDHTPEIRSFKDRRSGLDRRVKLCLDKLKTERRIDFLEVLLSPC